MGRQSLHRHQQDYAVPSPFILKQWQANKFDSVCAKEELLKTKEPKAKHYMEFIDWHNARTTATAHQKEIDRLNFQLNQKLAGFRHHPSIDEWMAQYDERMRGQRHRFKTLLFLGGSEQGKSQKAKSIFGPEHTLVVNCQGLGSALPSLRAFDRACHRAIVFDEGNEQQVLQNKLLFQAGPNLVALSQSVCNQHRYEIFVYQIAMIICSNRFQLTPSETLTPEDSEWLEKNVVVLTLQKGEKWYIHQ